jgi:hypothetical protein
MARLAGGQAPAWLRLVAMPQGSGLKVWEVLPPAQAEGTKVKASPFMQ